MYAKVLIEYEIKSLDHIFTYIIPSKFKDNIKKGMKVKVPFGKKIINGLVLDITENYEETYELKEIDSLVDENIIFSDELLKLGKYLQELTLCNLVTAYKAMLPSSLKIKNQNRGYEKFETRIKLVDKTSAQKYLSDKKRSQSQIEIINDLLNNESALANNYSKSSINTLINNNIIEKYLNRVYRINKDSQINYEKVDLTSEQSETFHSVLSSINEFNTHLIYGVTASGKTEVYFRLIEEVLKLGKTAIFLVPEITLTSQMINRFYERFGNIVAVYHSKLSDGEKYDEYLKIYNGEVKVVIGTRSAIFTPLNNLGIIILDEEHSENFKQDTNPRYNAIDIAKYRCKYNNIPLILGSATPSLESMARAKKNVYKLHVMSKRINNSKLPNVEIIDMASEIKKGNSYISEYLKDKIIDRLNKKQQIILLLNRRGFSPIITCSKCGYTYKCKNCDISLTYHKTSNNLRCHYCGYTIFKSDECPECHEKSLNYYGLGTEKLEEEVRSIFSNANIIRMDIDTTSKKGSHEEILNSFKNHEYDILIGTQMISKGLDFPLVTLVGVINADTSLNLPDFRSSEKTFSLLDQVSGRAGRKDLEGEVVIQTYNPTNEIIGFTKYHDYDGFYDYEMNIRKELKYPPYYFLTGLKVISKDYELASKEATKIYNYLKKNISSNSLILGPTTAAIFKANNLYRFQLIIKYKEDKSLKKALHELDVMYKENNKIFIEIDNNPSNI